MFKKLFLAAGLVAYSPSLVFAANNACCDSCTCCTEGECDCTDCDNCECCGENCQCENCTGCANKQKE